MSELRKDDKCQALISGRHGLSPVRTAVAPPCDETPLGWAIDAAAAKIVKPVLVGPEARIPPRDEPLNLDITGLSIVPQPYSHAAEPMTSPAAGDADISVLRDLEAGDTLAKELTFCQCRCARHRAGRPRSHDHHQPHRQCPHAHGKLRHRVGKIAG